MAKIKKKNIWIPACFILMGLLFATLLAGQLDVRQVYKQIKHKDSIIQRLYARCDNLVDENINLEFELTMSLPPKPIYIDTLYDTVYVNSGYRIIYDTVQVVFTPQVGIITDLKVYYIDPECNNIDSMWIKGINPKDSGR